MSMNTTSSDKSMQETSDKDEKTSTDLATKEDTAHADNNTEHVDKLFSAEAIAESEDENIGLKTTDQDCALEEALSDLVGFADTSAKRTAVLASLRYISKILVKIQNKPHDTKARRVLLKSFLVQKFIINVSGSLQVLYKIGFIQDMKESILEMPDECATDSIVLKRAIQLVDQKCERVNQALSKASLSDELPRKLCVGKCGFFGNSNTDGLCSKCYRNKEKSTLKNAKTKHGSSKKCVQETCDNFSSKSHEGMCNQCWQMKKNNGDTSKRRWRVARIAIIAFVRLQRCVATRPVQSDRRKCFKCKRKIGITVAPCSCSYSFCDRHRSTLDHECSFDFRRQHKLKLQQANPAIEGKKFNRLD